MRNATTQRALHAGVLAGILGWGLAPAPAAADFRLEKRLALAPGGRFTLEAEGGSVTVTGGEGDGATILVTSRADDVEERFDLRFEEGPGSVKVVSERRPGWISGWFDWGRHGMHFEVRVPRSTQVDLHTSGGSIEISGLAGEARLRTSGGSLQARDHEGMIDGRTSGGSIEVRAVRGSVDVDTSGGGIRVHEVSGDVVAETSGGSIEIQDVGGDVDADTSGGGVRVRGARGRVVAHSSGGPVSAVFAGAGEGGSLSSSGGGVRVAVHPAAALTIDASSSGGGVECDLPITIQGRVSRTSLRGNLNGGGPVLKLRSSGGGIRIAEAEAAN
jgi:hypothetical protein